MEPFKKIGVFLKHAPLDEAVLAFAVHMSDDPDRSLYFAHVGNPNDPETPNPPTAEQFEQMVREKMSDAGEADIKTAVLRGEQIVQILRAARDEDLDLAVLGRRLPSSQVGLGAKISRIVRKCPCSVLIVPELCKPHFDRIMVAVDCSEHSRMAFEAGLDVARHASGQRQVLAVSVREVPLGYDVAGITFVEAAERQRQIGRRDLEAFFASFDTTGVAVEPLVLLSADPALALTHAAMAMKMDLVIAGSRGASGATAALLGATSERLILSCATPTLIVKKKGETLGLLEALFSM